MKEKYEAPSAEIISFEDSDIITNSDTRLPAINGSGIGDLGGAPSLPSLPSLF